QRDQVDFQQAPFRQVRRLDRRPSGLVIAEVLGVDGVQRLEILEVGDVDGRFEDAVEVASAGAENGGEVLEHAMRLRAEIAFDEIVRGRVEGDLAGGVEDAVVFHRLGVRADGSGRVGCRNDLHRVQVLSAREYLLY